MSTRKAKKEEVQKNTKEVKAETTEKSTGKKDPKNEIEVNSSLPPGDAAPPLEDPPLSETPPGEPKPKRENNPWGKSSAKVSSAETSNKTSAEELRKKFEEMPKAKVRKWSKNNPKKQKFKKASAQKTQSSKERSKPKPDQNSSYTTEEESPAGSTEVKQFSFPSYKILSGASVADVQMYPQEVTIGRNEEDDQDGASWVTGLFQNTKMPLRLRLLRLFLIWAFFRVLNKQTAWISDKLGIGQPDVIPGGPTPKATEPGERFIRVFHDGSPNPFHVRVRPGMQPEMYK